MWLRIKCLSLSCRAHNTKIGANLNKKVSLGRVYVRVYNIAKNFHCSSVTGGLFASCAVCVPVIRLAEHLDCFINYCCFGPQNRYKNILNSITVS